MCVPIGHVFVFQVSTCLLADERARVCVPGAHICVFSRVDICVSHVYTDMCLRVHTSVFQLDTCLCSRRARICYQMNTRVCLCFLRAHQRVCSCVQYTCVCSLVHMCVFMCAYVCLPRVHICVFTCLHMCVLMRHTYVFQVNTCVFSDERSCVCVFRVQKSVYPNVCSTCAHMCVHVCAYVCSN